MDDVIVVDGLRKDYGSVQAVAGLTFTVRRGEVFALLGPNGAGKTTTVEILEGHRDRSSGSVSVLGFDPATGGREYRERIGIVLQDAGFDEEFTVRELVALYASLYPSRRDPDEVIDLVGLADKSGARTKTLSGGQRRRLDLALGLVGDPEVLFLDEPTTGFDPTARRRAWDLIRSLRDAGTTILLTTHYMEEAESLADRAALIVAGRLVVMGTPASLIAGETAGVIAFTLPPGVVADELPAFAGFTRVDGLAAVVETAEPTADLLALTTWAVARSVELPDLTLSRPTLEDVYLRLTGGVGGDS
ncbi:MAG: ABC transporter ATP-binding protein [Actinobacteria bacterium]|nr:ABC transporter ATP-binding protein [Actinomycetota bacterium]